MTPLVARFRLPSSTPPVARLARLVLDLVVAYTLFWAAHTAYRGSTGFPQASDSLYSMAAAERLARTGSLDLTPTLPTDPAALRDVCGYNPDTGLPYQLIRTPRDPARVYYGYPLGSVVLSAPWVRQSAARGQPPLDAAGHLSCENERELQVRLASRVAAGLVVVLYASARAVLPVWAALLAAAGFAFGSPVWSTLARAMWSHTWAAAWVAAAVGLLLAARRVSLPKWRSDVLLGIGLGTCLFCAGFCRQHTAISALAVGAYLLVWHRRVLAFTVLAGGVWAAGLVAVSLQVFGTPLPPSVYSAGVIDGQNVADRLFWLLCSPSRGLLVYCPYLAVSVVLLVLFRRTVPDRPLLLPSALAVGLHTAVFACYDGWHAGSSYGPRYFCDVLPWFALTTIQAGRAVLDSAGGCRQKALPVVCLAAAFVWGAYVHGRGANSVQAWFWNHRSAAVGQEDAVKEWRYPQFLAGVTFDVEPDGTVHPVP